MPEIIKIYTDGSCHTQLKVGAWATLIFIGPKRTILKGIEKDTTHNRMELLAVINGIAHMDKLGFKDQPITICSDSQYVVNLTSRQQKLKANEFITGKGTPIQNVDLVTTLLQQINTHTITFVKIKAHQRPDGAENFNREVDLIVRKLVRENVIKNDR